MYTVTRKDKITSSADSVEKGVKKSVLLSGGWDKPYAVAVLVIDGINPPAELHEYDADVFRVVAGQGEFILGGILKNKEKTGHGEYIGEGIEGGERRDVYPGDVIDIPPGVAHQFDVKGGRLELMIVKIRKANQ